MPEQAGPAQAAASPEGSLRPAREDCIVQLQLRLRKCEQERDRRTAFKGAAARQATMSRTAAGILKVTLPQDAWPAALHAAMTAAAFHSSMTAALKASSTALMPALLPLAHSMPRSHGHDVTMTVVLSERFRPAVYAWCAQYALMVKGHTIWGVLVLSSTLQNIIVRVSGTERLSVLPEPQGLSLWRTWVMLRAMRHGYYE